MIDVFKQKLRIASIEEALGLKRTELVRWNVLSIRGRMNEPPLAFPGARRVRTLHFDDVEGDIPEQGLFTATKADIESAIEFSRELRDEPLLIHCYAGISRSTAVAWIIIYDKLKGEPDAVRRAFEIVREVRPILLPNPHVLRLGIEVLVPTRTRRRAIEQFQDCLFELRSLKPILLLPKGDEYAAANENSTGIQGPGQHR